ncbi:type II secretion system minor pseudopilin GspH [Ferrimonas balearica]|uniref:type II secretion system minor pseudopilin GspH n=1 Tax=Ferrimonas balearica TaxID=44012 RepID=UPI001C55C577|nr:type II secretion system minor pseudopilin GspH [Ferrimonas balearica]MBW3141147.1 type II secretion system minor pseudopilin GspH [Ferrimonas balearica]MBY6108180.1 type II secretion system minor pseudopilin GspH [Ferrimonas balearica]
MVHAKPRQQASRQRGFTLLEILLVLVVMGLAAMSVTLVLGGDPRQEAMEKAGNEFRVVVGMALEEATLSGEQLGIVMEEDHYYFVRWNLDTEKWEPVGGDALYRDRNWPEGVEASVELEGMPLVQEDEDTESEFGLDESLFELSEEEKRKNPEPQLLLMPSGEMTGFTLLLLSDVPGQRDLELEMVGDPLGRINWLAELEEDPWQ